MSQVNPAIPVIFAQHATLQGKLLLEALRTNADFKFAVCKPEAADVLSLLRQFAAEVVLIANPGSCEQICEVVRRVHRKYTNCKQVVLLSEWQRSAVPELLRSGAQGVVNAQTAEIDTLCRCIAHVREGHFWLCSKELDVVLQQFLSSRSLQLVNRNGEELLSRRERDVVILLAEGMTNRDIALELGISHCTVRNYVSQIFDKVGVSTRTELVRFALSNHTSLARPPRRSDAGATPDGKSVKRERLKQAR